MEIFHSKSEQWRNACVHLENNDTRKGDVGIVYV